MFTNGILNGCYWFEEIELFLNMGGKIKKILYGLVFEKFDYVFNEFIEYFNKIKNLSAAHKIFGKLMINSLYGRMGMEKINTHSFFINKKDLSNFEDIEIISLKEVNDVILLNAEINNKLKKILKIPPFSLKTNIAVASAITSKARIKLYNAQQAVLNNEGRLLYSDTDSVFAAYKKNVLNEHHGEIF